MWIAILLCSGTWACEEAVCGWAQRGNRICEDQCNSSLCFYDFGDCVTAFTPAVVIVSTDIQHTDTWDRPIGGLIKALEEVWAEYTLILLTAETHYLVPESPAARNSPVITWRKTVEIRTEECTEIVPCTAKIKLTQDFVSFPEFDHLTLVNVAIEGGFPLIEGCSDCVYCEPISRRLSYHNSTNEYRNAEGSVGESACAQYHNLSLFSVSHGNALTFLNVSVTEVRHQLQSVISSDCGFVNLTNVAFTQVTVQSNDLQGGILAFRTETQPLCGTFSYTNGSVSLMNNGYEYSADWGFSGFLSASGLGEVNIEKVSFGFNFRPAALLYCKQCGKVAITRCEFHHNIVDFAVLLFEDLATDYGEVEVIEDMFRLNYARKAAIIHISTTLTETGVVLTGSSFASNSAPSILSSLLSGSCSFSNSVFLENNVNFLLSLRNMNNITLTHSAFHSNGDNSSPSDIIMRDFIENEESLVSVGWQWEALPRCTSFVMLRNVGNLTVSNVTFSRGYCGNGSAGLAIEGSKAVFTQFTISDTTFLNNNGDSIFRVTGVSIAGYIHGSSFINNSNIVTQHSACVSISTSSASVLSLSGVNFTNNKAVAHTCMELIGVSALSLHRTSVYNNTAVATAAGIVFSTLLTTSSLINITDSDFRSNAANATGALLLQNVSNGRTMHDVSIRLLLTRCRFVSNSADMSGAGVTSLAFVALSHDSSIVDCDFIENRCEEGGGAIFAEYFEGSLTVTRSRFIGNRGDAGAAIYHNFHSVEDRTRLLIIEHCEFWKNIGEDIILAEGLRPPIVWTRHSNFTGNEGISVHVFMGQWTDNSSLFLGNTGTVGGAVQLELANGTATRTVFQGNSATQEGGALVLTEISSMTCTFCTFLANTCDGRGGALYIDQNSQITIQNALFAANTVRDKGSAIYTHRSRIAVTDSNFTANAAGSYGTVFLASAVAEFANCGLSENTAAGRTPGIALTLSTLTVVNCTFRNQRGKAGGALFATDQSQGLVANSTVGNCSAGSGGAFVVIALSDFTFSDVTVANCSADTDGGVLSARISTLRFSHVTINRIKSAMDCGALFFLQSTATLSDCTVTELAGSAVYAFATSVTLVRSTFANISALRGGAVNCPECTALAFTESRFVNLTALVGGVVYAYTSGLAATSVSVFARNTFQANTAQKGGAFYFDNIFAEVRQNHFIHNSAYSSRDVSGSGVGGAVYTRCPALIHCTFLCANNTFAHNFANISGGAIHWFDSYPNISDSAMVGNSAKYGSDIASFPLRLALVDPVRQSVEAYLDSSLAQPVVLRLQAVSSGQPLSVEFSIGLVDHYGQIVTIDSSSSAALQAGSAELDVYGNTQSVAASGVFRFSNISFGAEPGSRHSSVVSSPAVNEQLKYYFFDPNAYINSVRLELSFRQCLPGESRQPNACYICPQNTYSLDPSDPCLTCPDSAVCYGGVVMVPKPGYWRPDAMSDLFFECLNPDACLGSTDANNPSLTGECARGYRSNLCSSCKPGYSSSGLNECALCPSLASNIALTSILVLLVLMGISLLVVLSIRAASRPRSDLATFAKVFVNYLQMVVVSASVRIKWPTYAALFINGQKTASNATEQLFSIECLLKEFTSDSVYYINLTIGVAVPAALILASGMIWTLLFILSATKHAKEKMIGSVVLIVFLLHTNLTKLAFSVFNCRELQPGEFWLVSDLSLQCWNAEHIGSILRLALPGLIVWVVGLPSLSLMLLVRSKQQLIDSKTMLKFSFLYKGYRRELYFWEFVILYRKIAVVCLSVFLTTVSTGVQALSMLAVVLVCFALQLYISPFHTATFNALELKALLAAFVTLYSVLYFDTESTSSRYSDSIVNVGIFTLIVAANCYFAGSWLKAVLPILYHTLKSRLFTLAAKKERTVLEDGCEEDKGSSHLGQSSSISPPFNTSINLEHRVTPV